MSGGQPQAVDFKQPLVAQTADDNHKQHERQTTTMSSYNPQQRQRWREGRGEGGKKVVRRQRQRWKEGGEKVEAKVVRRCNCAYFPIQCNVKIGAL